MAPWMLESGFLDVNGSERTKGQTAGSYSCVNGWELPNGSGQLCHWSMAWQTADIGRLNEQLGVVGGRLGVVSGRLGLDSCLYHMTGCGWLGEQCRSQDVNVWLWTACSMD